MAVSAVPLSECLLVMAMIQINDIVLYENFT